MHGRYESCHRRVKCYFGLSVNIKFDEIFTGHDESTVIVHDGARGYFRVKDAFPGFNVVLVYIVFRAKGYGGFGNNNLFNGFRARIYFVKTFPWGYVPYADIPLTVAGDDDRSAGGGRCDSGLMAFKIDASLLIRVRVIYTQRQNIPRDHHSSIGNNTPPERLSPNVMYFGRCTIEMVDVCFARVVKSK